MLVSPTAHKRAELSDFEARHPPFRQRATFLYKLVSREPCLDRVVPMGERHLRRLIDEYSHHYHLERPHQGLGKQMITQQSVEPRSRDGPVLCFDRLGGLLRFYRRKAA